MPPTNPTPQFSEFYLSDANNLKNHVICLDIINKQDMLVALSNDNLRYSLLTKLLNSHKLHPNSKSALHTCAYATAVKARASGTDAGGPGRSLFIGI